MKYICECGSDKFQVYLDVWSNDIVCHPHLEVVCLICNKGFVLEYKDKPKLNKKSELSFSESLKDKKE